MIPAFAALSADPKGVDIIGLMLGASGVVLVVLALLVAASCLVWLIWFLKSAQISRLRSTHRNFEKAATGVERASDLIALAIAHKAAPGARVVLAVAKRAIATEQQRTMALMPTLSSIASAAPFIGLFGTVWGIMEAFVRIGVEKSASLPVVAPAIGEALIATAFGLVAAIPATIAFNYVDKRIGDLLDELSASAEVWVETLIADPSDARGRG